MTTTVDRLAFHGRWAQRGLIRVPVVDEKPAAVLPRPGDLDHKARKPCEAGRRPKYRATICDCGCLIVPGETCPACLAWAEHDAVVASWRAAERANRQAAS